MEQAGTGPTLSPIPFSAYVVLVCSTVGDVIGLASERVSLLVVFTQRRDGDNDSQ